jgi:AraC-like DNA-binding protein
VKAILEKISRAAQDSFTSFSFKRRKFDCPFHYHPECELTLIVNSTGQRFVGDNIGRFGAGDLVLMGPDLPHMYINEGAYPGHSHARVLQFLPDCLGTGFLQCGEAKGLRLLIERSRVGLAFHGHTRDKVAGALAALEERQGLDRLVAFLGLLDTLARSREFRVLGSPGYSPSLSLYQGERINRACALISGKFRENITQSEAARAARMSGPSFSRFFRRATNKTFRAFLNEVRIGHASRALLETDQTVAEVCYGSGFSNLSNFNRQFRRLRKISPREFRRRIPRALSKS